MRDKFNRNRLNIKTRQRIPNSKVEDISGCHRRRTFSSAFAKKLVARYDRYDRARNFSSEYFPSYTQDKLLREEARIASRIPCPCESPTVSGESSSLFYDEACNISFRFIDEFVYRKQSGSSRRVSRIPFQRVYRITGGRWLRPQSRARARSLKPVLRRELLIRFSRCDSARPYKSYELSKHTIHAPLQRARYTSPRCTNYRSSYREGYTAPSSLILILVQSHRKTATFLPRVFPY